MRKQQTTVTMLPLGTLGTGLNVKYHITFKATYLQGIEDGKEVFKHYRGVVDGEKAKHPSQSQDWK